MSPSSDSGRLHFLHSSDAWVFTGAIVYSRSRTDRSSIEESPSDAQPLVPSAAQRRVLIVDDNRDSAISLSMLLSLSGYDTKTAFDGEEALSVAQRFDPDVVLLDLGLPKLSGFDVCRRLRTTTCGRALVIIAVTGWGMEDDRLRSLDAGFDALLLKPVDPDVLRQKLREVAR